MGICASSSEIKQKDETSHKLSPREIEIIKNSWKPIVSSGLAKHGTNMMVRVFIEHRELKPMWRFANNLETREQMNNNYMIKAHGEKLFNAIDMAINSLDDLNTLVPILVQLGSSHCNYGVKEEHFEIIGGVLIETLSDALKEKFTPKIKRTWLKLFTIVSSQMKVGLRQQSEQESNKLANKQLQNIEIQINDPDSSNYIQVNGNFNKVFPNDCPYENVS